ncbi:MAG: 6,7-dimethyl-8-ribityllumazine synthase [Armatimonadetes bacterium]|nr:6,7-dimethyl-8-ribityllumazine synthase [Armatimonadota bacterium]
MSKSYEGSLVAEGLRFGIVASRFNDLIVQRLLSGALDTLARHGAKEAQVETAWVPGSFEVPLVAQRLAESGRYDAVICLAAIIRGATPHFEYVAAEASKGIAQVSQRTGVPVIYGVVTADTIEQAVERAGTKAGNRGVDAARSAIEMANLMRELPKKGKAGS